MSFVSTSTSSSTSFLPHPSCMFFAFFFFLFGGEGGEERGGHQRIQRRGEKPFTRDIIREV